MTPSSPTRRSSDLHLRPWPEGGWTGAAYGVTWNHLWYLAYLWIYTGVLVLVLPLLGSAPVRRASDWLLSRRGWWLIVPPAQIGRAHVCNPVTNAQLVCRLLREKNKISKRQQ